MTKPPGGEAQRLCRDLLCHSAILGQTSDAQAIRALRELIRETEERVFALKEAAESAAGHDLGSGPRRCA